MVGRPEVEAVEWLVVVVEDESGRREGLWRMIIILVAFHGGLFLWLVGLLE